MYTTNEQIARRVYRSLKTASDNERKSDPILAFHFKGKDDFILMRCNKDPEITIKGKDQPAGEVKFFAYSDFADYDESDVIFKLRDQTDLIELYRKGPSPRSPGVPGANSPNGWTRSTRTACRSP